MCPCVCVDRILASPNITVLTHSSQDHDNDSKVSLEDFKQAIEEERLLIEAFGPCLPDDNLLEEFSAKIFQTS